MDIYELRTPHTVRAVRLSRDNIEETRIALNNVRGILSATISADRQVLHLVLSGGRSRRNIAIGNYVVIDDRYHDPATVVVFGPQAFEELYAKQTPLKPEIPTAFEPYWNRINGSLRRISQFTLENAALVTSYIEGHASHQVPRVLKERPTANNPSGIELSIRRLNTVSQRETIPVGDYVCLGFRNLDGQERYGFYHLTSVLFDQLIRDGSLRKAEEAE